MYERIAKETVIKNRLQKQLNKEIKEREKLSEKPKKIKENVEVQMKKLAEYQLRTEIQHQKEESERTALVNEMLSDAKANSPKFNTSCLNVLRNFQGIQIYTFFPLPLI